METIYVAIAVFGMTALIGMYLLSLVLRKKETPKALSFTHGIFAIIGVALLFFYCATHESGPVESTIIFVMALFGGIILIYRDLTGKKIPKWLAIGHGLIAIAGFILLVCFALE